MGLLSTIEVVVFDLDNTLVNRQRALVRWLLSYLSNDTSRDRAERHDAVRHIVAVDDWGGTDRATVVGEICQLANLPRRSAEGMSGTASTPGRQTLTPFEVDRAWQAGLARQIRPDGRVHGLLRRICSTVQSDSSGSSGPYPRRIALATNGSMTNQRAKLSAAQLDDFPWELIAISQAVGASKPDSTFFDYVQQRLDVPAERLLMVGDDWERDIQGAAKAGWRTCWPSWGRPQPSEGVSADVTIACIDELSCWWEEANVLQGKPFGQLTDALQ